MGDSIRESIGRELAKLGNEYSNLYVVDCDMAKHTKLNFFFENHPSHAIQVGIAEQNGISLAAGLSSEENIVVVSSFAVFITGRAWEQIRHSVCYNDSNVKILGSHSGLAAAYDGGSHQCLEDIALMTSLPNMTVLSPIDAKEGKEMIRYAVKHRGPYYIRIGRNETKNIFDNKYSFKIGEPVVLESGVKNKTAIISSGEIGIESLGAAKILREEYYKFVKVIHIPTLKPLNIQSLIKCLEGIENVLVIEEHNEYGGLGAIIASGILGKTNIKRFVIKGLNNFGETGSYSQLKKKYGLNEKGIVKEILDMEDKDVISEFK